MRRSLTGQPTLNDAGLPLHAGMDKRYNITRLSDRELEDMPDVVPDEYRTQMVAEAKGLNKCVRLRACIQSV